MLTLIIFLAVLSVLVLAHELGHFSTAKMFKIKVEEFGLGFPPRAIGCYKNKKGKRAIVKGKDSWEKLNNNESDKVKPKDNSTIYSLNWLPLGGFVKIKGENGEGKNEEDSFSSKSIWKRTIVLSAGVIMNVILAWVLYSAGYMIGLPQATSEDNLGKNAIVSESAVALIEITPDSPAEKAGLEVGDIVLEINGEKVGGQEELQNLISKEEGNIVKLLISRDKETIELEVQPEYNETEKRALMGVGIFSTGTVRYPFFSSLIEGAKLTGWTLKEIVVAFGNLFKDIFSGVKVGDQFAGPVGIATYTGQAANMGFVYLLQFMAILSLNLAIINILPFPALDGGRILFLIIEKFKGKPVKKEIENIVNNIGFYLLIALIIFITFKDIMRLF